MTTPNRTAPRARWTALPLGLALVGALVGFPALAQGAASDAAAGAGAAAATTAAPPRAGAFLIRRGPDGAIALHGMRFDPRDMDRRGAIGDRREATARRLHERLGSAAEDPRSAALARWLGADADSGPLIPGLVGRVADGTTVRLTFYAGAPDEGGAELADLSFVAGADDAATFRAAVRAAAEGASHVAVDVLGRVVALPEASPADAAD